MLRVPARAGLIAFAAVSVLAAFGWIRLLEWISPRIRFRNFSESHLTGIIVLLLGIEFFSAPVPLLPEVSGDRIPAVYHYLREYSEPGGIVELPVTGHSDIEGEHDKRIYTYFSAYHFKPIVIGYSGYNPPTFGQLMAAARNLPSEDALDLFEAIGVRSIILHTNELSTGEVQMWEEAIASSSGLDPVAAFPDGSRLVALIPVLRISQNLNDLKWEAVSTEINSDRTVPLTLRALGIHSTNIDYVVNPQLPRPPIASRRRVGTSRIEAGWYNSIGLVHNETISARLPYLMNDAVLEFRLNVPKLPGNYEVRLVFDTTPPLTVSTRISIPSRP